MCTEINRELAAAKQRIEHHRTLTRREVELREAIGQQTYRCETFEIKLDMLARDIQKLEGFGLSSLLSGMLGGKEQRIAAKRADLDNVHQQLENCQQDVERLQKELSAVVPELEALQGCEEQYQTLFARKEAAVLDEAGEHTVRLSELKEQENAITDMLRNTRKAAEAADSLLTHVNSAKISVRQVSNRKLDGQGLVGGVFNVAMNQALKPSHGGVERSMERLLEKLEIVRQDLSPEGAAQEQELNAEIQQFCENFFARVAMDEDCVALTSCETETSCLQRSLLARVSDLQARCETLAAERDDIIEKT